MPVIGCMADNGYFCVLILVLGAGNKSVKITLILPILNDTVFLKFALGKGFCNGRCHFSFMMQHFLLVKLQKRIQPCDPILHIHDVPTVCLSLGMQYETKWVSERSVWMLRSDALLRYSFFYSGDNDYRNSVVSFCNTALLLISDFFSTPLANQKEARYNMTK